MLPGLSRSVLRSLNGVIAGIAKAIGAEEADGTDRGGAELINKQ